MNPSRAADFDASTERKRVLEILRTCGWNATSFQVLEPGFQYWFDPSGACVAYVDTGKAWVAAGAPFVAEDRLAAVAQSFVAEAHARGRRVCFFASEERFAQVAPLQSLLIGEQPVWDPARWSETVSANRSLREQLRRARSKGVTVRSLPPDEVGSGPSHARVEELISRWLAARSMPPLGFLVQIHPFSFAAERRYFVAEQQGQIVAFLAAVPVFARGGWMFEDLLRDPAAPNGTIELLVDAAMRASTAEGSRYVTLGLAPLAGPIPLWLRTARIWGAGLFDFRGLQAFKTKLRPTDWDSIFLCYPKGQGAIAAVHDVLTSFADGHLLRFGVRTLLRGPSIVIRLLAILLVPWTALLMSPPARAFFPSRAVQLAWVAFDVALAGGLLVLGRRWRDGLAWALAAAVTLDAALTAIQAVVFNFPRVKQASDAVPIVVAMLAPLFASVVLWRAQRRKRSRP